jgi:HSP20 family molecular chaperone IbpA
MSDTPSIEKHEAPTGEVEQTRGGRTYVPVVDIVEKDDELLLLADVPGVRADDIDIDYERGELRVVARVDARQDESTRYVLREYGTGDFVRTFRVGNAIDHQRIEAEVADGVLTLHLPKAEAVKTRKISVKSV